MDYFWKSETKQSWIISSREGRKTEKRNMAEELSYLLSLSERFQCNIKGISDPGNPGKGDI